MILEKFWRTAKSQLNKLANRVWSTDPIAHLQYEYDVAVGQLQEGRKGLEQYRALVERVARQVQDLGDKEQSHEARARALLQIGDRTAAGQAALELERTRGETGRAQTQLAQHEQAYERNVAQIKQATKHLAAVREKIARYDAELKMTQAEAELAQLTGGGPIDSTTDFGKVEQLVQEKIGLNRAKVRVAADLTGQPLDPARDQATEQALAELALEKLERQLSAGGIDEVTRVEIKRIDGEPPR
jgi:phage shock protein A